MFSQVFVCLRGRGVSVQGVSVQEGVCQGDPPYGKERAVRILLECFLVVYKIHILNSCSFNHKQKRTSVSSKLNAIRSTKPFSNKTMVLGFKRLELIICNWLIWIGLFATHQLINLTLLVLEIKRKK